MGMDGLVMVGIMGTMVGNGANDSDGDGRIGGFVTWGGVGLAIVFGGV